MVIFFFKYAKNDFIKYYAISLTMSINNEHIYTNFNKVFNCTEQMDK